MPGFARHIAALAGFLHIIPYPPRLGCNALPYPFAQQSWRSRAVRDSARAGEASAMDTTILGLAAGAAGWKAGHVTIRSHGPLLRPTHPAVPDLVTDPEVELCQRAAAHARRYMRQTLATQLDLT